MCAWLCARSCDLDEELALQVLQLNMEKSNRNVCNVEMFAHSHRHTDEIIEWLDSVQLHCYCAILCHISCTAKDSLISERSLSRLLGEFPFVICELENNGMAKLIDCIKS